MKELITIDGSEGEGGGQILRTALSLSLLLRHPVVITNIRAKRRKPGLLRQHLTCVHAAARVGAAHLEGADLGSTELSFTPTGLHGGHLRFDIGTAGSTSLVLQTILLPLLYADRPSIVTVTGGTHNEMAPPFEALSHSFCDILRRMGADVVIDLERHGFFPAGGGIVHAHITPSQLKPIELQTRGEVKSREVVSVISRLDHRIAEREITEALRLLNWTSPMGSTRVAEAPGPGNVLLSTLRYENLSEVFIAHGRPGISAEQVALNLVRDMRPYIASSVPVWEHLADQLLLPFALAGAGTFCTRTLSLHSRTNLQVIGKFLDLKIHIEELPDRLVLLTFG